MAIAGGTAPCMSLTWDPERNVLVIGHQENRLLKIQVEVVNPETGNVTKKTIPTGAAEMDIEKAIKVLFSSRVKPVSVWIRSQDRRELTVLCETETIPRQLLFFKEGKEL